MMKRLMLITGIAIYSLFAAAMLFNTGNSDKPVEWVSIRNYSSKPAAVTEEADMYVVKIVDKKIAVENAKTGEIIKKTDTFASILPKGDRALLSRGIKVKSDKELRTVLEDYCS